MYVLCEHIVRKLRQREDLLRMAYCEWGAQALPGSTASSLSALHQAVRFGGWELGLRIQVPFASQFRLCKLLLLVFIVSSFLLSHSSRT